MEDTASLICTETSFAFEKNLDRLARITDELKTAAFEALTEEAVLVVAFKIYHSGRN